jgi:hypothetical protein
LRALQAAPTILYVAFLLRLPGIMNTAISPRFDTGASAQSVGILRWVFIRGTYALTCEVRINGRDAHHVSVVPHWDVSSSVVEHFAQPSGALLRHAELASQFRHAGWVLVREGRTPGVMASA